MLIYWTDHTKTREVLSFYYANLRPKRIVEMLNDNSKLILRT